MQRSESFRVTERNKMAVKNFDYLRKKGVGKGDEEMVGLKTVEVTPT